MTDYTGSNTPADQPIWKPIHGYEGLYEACSSPGKFAQLTGLIDLAGYAPESN